MHRFPINVALASFAFRCFALASPMPQATQTPGVDPTALQTPALVVPKMHTGSSESQSQNTGSNCKCNGQNLPYDNFLEQCQALLIRYLSINQTETDNLPSLIRYLSGGRAGTENLPPQDLFALPCNEIWEEYIYVPGCGPGALENSPLQGATGVPSAGGSGSQDPSQPSSTHSNSPPPQGHMGGPSAVELQSQNTTSYWQCGPGQPDGGLTSDFISECQRVAASSLGDQEAETLCEGILTKFTEDCNIPTPQTLVPPNMSSAEPQSQDTTGNGHCSLQQLYGDYESVFSENCQALVPQNLNNQQAQGLCEGIFGVWAKVCDPGTPNTSPSQGVTEMPSAGASGSPSGSSGPTGQPPTGGNGVQGITVNTLLNTSNGTFS